MKEIEPPARIRKRYWAFIFVCATLLLIAVSFAYYQNEIGRIRADKYREISAIGQMKANQIEEWRAQRLREANVFGESPFLAEAVKAWLDRPDSLEAKSALLARMKHIQETLEYADVILFDERGNATLFAVMKPAHTTQFTMAAIDEAAASKKAVLSDLFRCSDNTIHLDAIAPILGADGKPLAFLALRSDAHSFLFPLIQSWPVPNASAETLLVRRDGEDALYLNELLFQDNTALTYRIPLTETDTPAVQAVLGKEGIFDGKDYSGKDVLADLHPINNSPWFIVAKINRAEVMAKAGIQSAFIAIIAILLILVVGAAVAVGYRQRQARLYKTLLQTEIKARDEALASEERFRATLYSIGDGIITTDKQGFVQRLNPIAERLTGWNEADALGKPVSEVFHIVNEETRREVENPVLRVLREGAIVGLSNHTLLLSRNGAEFPIADSGAPIRDANGNITGVILDFRDQTEERAAQKKLRESEERYRSLFNSMTEGFALHELVCDDNGNPRDYTFLDINPAFERLTGLKRADLIGRTQGQVLPTEDSFWLETYSRVALTGESVHLEHYSPSLKRHYEVYAYRSAPRQFATIFVDVTERKQAQQEIEVLARFSSENPNPVLRVNQNGILLYVNEAGRAYLPDWELVIGEPAPQVLREAVSASILEQSKRTIEIIQGGRALSFFIAPIAGSEYVNLYGRDITLQKQEEEFLRESEQRFRAMADFTYDWEYWIGLDQKLVYISPSCERITGYAAQEFVNNPNLLLQIIHPEDRSPYEEHWNKAPISTEIASLDFRVHTRDGREIWINHVCRPVYDAEGKSLGRRVSNRDITERKQAEEETRLNEARYRSLFDDSPLSLWEEDWSEVKKRFDQLKAEGVTNFQRYFKENPQVANHCISLIRLVDVNKAAMDLYGANTKQEVLIGLGDMITEESKRVLYEELSAFAEGQLYFEREDVAQALGGEKRFVLFRLGVMRGYEETLGKMLLYVVDITERKQAEQAMRESEERFRAIFEQAALGVGETDTHSGLFLSVNQKHCDILGYSREELLTMTFKDVTHPDDLPADLENLARLQRGEIETFSMEKRYVRKDGKIIWANLTVSPLWTVYVPASGQTHLAVIEDISVRKRAAEIVRENEERFRAFFEQAAIGVAEIDTQSGRFLNINQKYCDILGYAREELTQMNFQSLTYGEDLSADLRNMERLTRGEIRTFSMEKRYVRKNGEIIWVNLTVSPLWMIYQPTLGQTHLAIVEDITERKRSDAESQFLYNVLNTSLNEIYIFDAQTLRFEYVSAGALKELGYSLDDMGKMTPLDIKPEYTPEIFTKLIDPLRRRDLPSLTFETVHRRANGSRYPVEVHLQLVDDGDHQVFLAVVLDLTEKKQAEELLRIQGAALEAAANAIILSNSDGTIRWANHAFTELTGYGIEETVGRSLRELTDSGKHDREVYVTMQNTILLGQPWKGELICRRKDGKLYDEELTITPLLNAKGAMQYTISVLQDISERRRAEEKIHTQVDFLTALRDIDQVITSGFEMSLSLNTLLSRAVSLLSSDGAAILLVNHALFRLEYAAKLGFRTRALNGVHVNMSMSLPSMALLERRIVHVEDLAQNADNPIASALSKDEGFVSYYGVPLIAKGDVLGVLEIFHREPMEHGEEWLELLNTLASRASIAIENATMFNNIQRSNVELTMAYDATIEGWSRALELRDEETKGHTLRVTEKTVQLARLLGINDEQLIQIRRGALLHDIGKIGVPDKILLKTGPLTKKDWDVIKKHPVYAHDMLSPINYLRPAMDIPYCHHEKWDGTGYPRGLKGEQIPLSARIFAVVDVWDALISDRPYSKAWPEEKVRAYILSLAGTHFDPDIARAFLGGTIKIRE